MRLRAMVIPFALAGLAVALLASASEEKRVTSDPAAEHIAIGYRIAPVHLSLHNRDRSLVGLGSYIVNAQAGCNDCHTNPPYAAGGDPYLGQPKQFNADRYLAGGTAFGPIISRNITPDADG